MMLRGLGIKHMDLDVTDRCNFGCTYCYHSKNNQDAGHILPEVKKKVVEILRTHRMVTGKHITVAFFGGEPMVNWQGIKDIVVATYLQKWTVTSNLSLLVPEMKQFFKDHRGSVHCSIDGCEEAHNKFRVTKGGKSTWDQVATGAKLALEINPNATARATVMPETVEFLYKDVQSFLQMGFKKTALMLVNEVQWSEQKWQEYERELVKLAEFNIRYPNFYIKNFFDAIRGEKRKGKGKKAKRCGAGWNMVAISTNGHVFPCHRFSSKDPESPWCFGNILDDELDIDKIREYRETFTIPTRCQGCQSYQSCSMGCPHTSMMAGDINFPTEVHCEYMWRTRPIALNMYNKIKAKPNVYDKLLAPKRGNVRRRRDGSVNALRTDRQRELKRAQRSRPRTMSMHDPYYQYYLLREKERLSENLFIF